jgi:hypothetical protein
MAIRAEFRVAEFLLMTVSLALIALSFWFALL